MKKYYIAAIASIVYIALITIVGELFPPVKDFLKNTFWHHWLGKSVVLVLLFALVSFFAGKISDTDTAHDEKYLNWIFAGAALGALSIFIFFVLEYSKII